MGQEKSQRSDPYTQPCFQDIQRKDSKIQKQIICMANVHSIAPLSNPIPNDNNIWCIWTPFPTLNCQNFNKGNANLELARATGAIAHARH